MLWRAPRTLSLLLAALLVGCGGASAPDAGGADAGTTDAPPADAQGLDAALDAAVPGDAGEDAGDLDAAISDASDAGALDSGTPPGTVLMRVVAANLTSGNGQDYDRGHGLRILDGLNPDVVLIQELNYGSNAPQTLRRMVDTTFGAEFSYYRAETGNLPNGVISRWPILDSGTWADDEVGNRGFSWARIDVPGPTDLWAVSLHLLTANGGVRTREANQLVDYIEANVPAGDYLVVGGDLNTNTRSEGAVGALRQVVSTTYVPVDRDGNDGTNASRSKPYDWVMPDLDLEAHHTPVRIADQDFPAGLVFDTRVFTPISAVPPAQLEDSDAPQMQHMAVVRDFLLPAP